MEYTGLDMELVAFDFNEALHAEKNIKCKIDTDIKFEILENKLYLFTVDLQYFKLENRLEPLASIRATLKVNVDYEKRDVESSECVLFSIKTLFRFICFQFYQKLTPINLRHFYIPIPTDKQIFYAAYLAIKADLQLLEFDANGRYRVSM